MPRISQRARYESVEALCADADVEAVYVATPHQFHAEHVAIAAAHGKHVLVEKPMALTLEDCGAMCEAVNRAGVKMVIGHSHSFDAPIARTRELIASGAYGRLRMITAMNFTDFLYRPRGRRSCAPIWAVAWCSIRRRIMSMWCGCSRAGASNRCAR